jgi:hypothetical protein
MHAAESTQGGAGLSVLVVEYEGARPQHSTGNQCMFTTSDTVPTVNLQASSARTHRSWRVLKSRDAELPACTSWCSGPYASAPSFSSTQRLLYLPNWS